MTRRLLVAAALLLASAASHADVMVLVHGYLGEPASWERSGLTEALANRGWVYGGRLRAGTGIPDDAGPVRRGAHGTVYTANLPSTAPLMIQSDFLWTLLQQVFLHHPDEPVVLVGHSAGGVVARLALVRFGKGNVETLVTIAAPHLGTPRALQGLDVIQDSGPFELIKGLVGGEDYRRAKGSAGALWDLSPPRPGNLLYWLNSQEHPAIRYISVVRLPDRDGGDELVPVFSQDMNQLPQLRGKAEVSPTFGDHFLRRSDALLLARLLGETGPRP